MPQPKSRSEVKLRLNPAFLANFDKFAKAYQSRNKAIIDLIKTHPSFIKHLKNGNNT